MKIRAIFLISTILLASVLVGEKVYAATYKVKSCSQDEVQQAINSSVSGDIVLVPAGECTWSSKVSVPNGKKITLQGQGISSTIIAGAGISLNQSGSRITGFDIKNGIISADGDGWRIDHCKLTFDTWTDGIYIAGHRRKPARHPTGLIDNCIFNNMRILVVGTVFMLAEGTDQHELWAQAHELGTTDAVFVEDCIFNGTIGTINAIDANYGGRYVFRYNTLNDTYIEAHSVQGTNRATRSWEIYNNTFNQINKVMWVPMFLRGGTGVVFDNTINGTWSNTNIALDNVRSCNNVGDGGKCDGTSRWDANETGQDGHACRDQIGRSGDTWLWTNDNPYPPQASDPAYAWNNKHGDNDVIFYQHNCSESAAHIQPSRDYFNNVQKPGYTPFQYPHPLRTQIQPVQDLKQINFSNNHFIGNCVQDNPALKMNIPIRAARSCLNTDENGRVHPTTNANQY